VPKAQVLLIAANDVGLLYEGLLPLIRNGLEVKRGVGARASQRLVRDVIALFVDVIVAEIRANEGSS